MPLPDDEFGILQDKLETQRQQAVIDLGYSNMEPHQYEVIHCNIYPTKIKARAKKTTQKKAGKHSYAEQLQILPISVIREQFAYKPPLEGKAAEFFGVQDVRDL